MVSSRRKSSRFTGSLAMSSSQSIVSQKKFNISKSQVSIGALRGSGGFGRVYQGKLYGTDVAVKEIVVQEDDIMKIQQELYSLDAARHPNVVTLMGAVVEEFPKVYIITEWVDGGDLHDWIYKGRGRHASIGEILNLLHKVVLLLKVDLFDFSRSFVVVAAVCFVGWFLYPFFFFCWFFTLLSRLQERWLSCIQSTLFIVI